MKQLIEEYGLGKLQDLMTLWEQLRERGIGFEELGAELGRIRRRLSTELMAEQVSANKCP
mgnify:CR=1 FL=1